MLAKFSVNNASVNIKSPTVTRNVIFNPLYHSNSCFKVEKLFSTAAIREFRFLKIEASTGAVSSSSLSSATPIRPPGSKALSQLLSNVDVLSIDNRGDPSISSVVYDSRQVKPGSLFVAVKGYSSDGHDYIANAVSNGAVAVVVSRPLDTDPALSQAAASINSAGASIIVVPDSREALAAFATALYENPSQCMRVIGITGTNGKTTTSYLVRSILRAHGEICGLIGTIAYWVDDKEYPAPFTTPEAADMQKLMGEMAQTGPFAVGDETSPPCKAVVMEVSSHALELGRVRGIEYDTALFTNLTRDHLDFHETFENYRDAKAKLFKQLHLPARKSYPKVALINGDDSYAAFFVDVAHGVSQPDSNPSVRVYTYGMATTNDIHPVETKLSLFETIVRISTPRAADGTWSEAGPREELTVHTKLRGSCNVYNVLAAVAVGVANNIPAADIEQGLASVNSVSGRFESVSIGGQQEFGVIVDYAHTPDALERLLKGVREIMDPRARLISVFGCGGDRDRGKRPIMGKIGTDLCDLAIITSDNPRTEDPDFIVNQVMEGAEQGVGKYEVIVDRREAINRAISLGQPGDAVVIAGKGHEDYQIIGKTKIHFDDREEARAALVKRFS